MQALPAVRKLPFNRHFMCASVLCDAERLTGSYCGKADYLGRALRHRSFDLCLTCTGPMCAKQAAVANLADDPPAAARAFLERAGRVHYVYQCTVCTKCNRCVCVCVRPNMIMRGAY